MAHLTERNGAEADPCFGMGEFKQAQDSVGLTFIFKCTFIENEISFYAVDHSARGSMKNAASCVK